MRKRDSPGEAILSRLLFTSTRADLSLLLRPMRLSGTIFSERDFFRKIEERVIGEPRGMGEEKDILSLSVIRKKSRKVDSKRDLSERVPGGKAEKGFQGLSKSLWVLFLRGVRRRPTQVPITDSENLLGETIYAGRGRLSENV